MKYLCSEFARIPTFSADPRCTMGGLEVHPNKPAPWYHFEMLHAENHTVFLNFKVTASLLED